MTKSRFQAKLLMAGMLEFAWEVLSRVAQHGLLPDSAKPRLADGGATIPDAFVYMDGLETACQTQLAAQSAGVVLTEINLQIVAGIKEQIEMVTRGMGGSLVWPGLLRKLDRIDPTYRD